MNVKLEIRVAVFGLLFLQLLTAVVALVLFGRTAPTVEKIIDENVRSLVAVEEMQQALIVHRAGVSDADSRERFTTALANAKDNITVEAERMSLRVIEGSWHAAFDGDEQSMMLVADSLSSLARHNRESISASSDASQRMATSAGWAVVVLAAIGLGFGVLAVRRTNEQIVEPIREIYRSAEAYHRGDKLRRCNPSMLTAEFKVLADAFNALMDAQLVGARDLPIARIPSWINQVLDSYPTAMAVVNTHGDVLAANRQALDWLAHVELHNEVERLKSLDPPQAIKLDERTILVVPTAEPGPKT